MYSWIVWVPPAAIVIGVVVQALRDANGPAERTPCKCGGCQYLRAHLAAEAPAVAWHEVSQKEFQDAAAAAERAQARGGK